MSEALGKHQCAACGTVRKTLNLRYDPTTFLPYCQHAEICSPGHPNSPTSILERGQGINLITLKEAEDFYKEKLLISLPDAEAVAEIRKLLEKPTSLRVQSPDLAKYLVQVKKEYSMDTMAETVRYLLTLAMESHGEFYADRRKIDADQRKRQSIEDTIREMENGTRNSHDEPGKQIQNNTIEKVTQPGSDLGISTTHEPMVEGYNDRANENDVTRSNTNEPTRPTESHDVPVESSDDGGWDF